MEGRVYSQLYSFLKTNQSKLVESLKAMSEIGYDGVELMGTYTAGMSIPEYRQFLKELKLDPISSHALLNEEDYEIARELGVRYTDVRAEHLPDTKMSTVLEAAEKMNEEGKLRAKHGLKGVLHNHSQEFRFIEGRDDLRVYDVLIQNTDPLYVGFEFDVGWGAFSGADPISFINKYPGRFPLIHVKEATRVALNDDELEHFPKEVLANCTPTRPSHPEAGTSGIEELINLFPAKWARYMYELREWNGKLGEGIVDWKAFTDACIAQGTEAFICEREYYGYIPGNESPYPCAIDDYNYLRSL